MMRKYFAYWPEPGSNLNQLQVGVARQIVDLSPIGELWGSLVFVTAIAIDMPHSRVWVARKEDLAGDLALDRISSCAIPTAMEECKPLIGTLSVRDIVVPDVGLLSGARKNCAFANVADEAETKPRGRNVGHQQNG